MDQEEVREFWTRRDYHHRRNLNKGDKDALFAYKCFKNISKKVIRNAKFHDYNHNIKKILRILEYYGRGLYLTNVNSVCHHAF